MKIFGVGDIHFNDATPASRKDQYPLTILRKFEALAAMIQPEDLVVLTGDVFHKPKVEEDYLGRVAEVLAPLRGRIYTIFGNHDFKDSSVKKKKSTSLRVLISSGVIEYQDTLDIGNYRVVFVDFDEDILSKKQEGDFIPIYVAHRFVLDGHYVTSVLLKSECLVREEIEQLGKCIILAGHDHIPYPLIRIGEATIVRPGALSRGTAHAYNMSREVFVAVMDLEDASISFKKVPIRPKEEVFQEDTPLVYEEVKRDLEAFTVFLRSRKIVNVSSITRIIKSLNLSTPVRVLVERYLQQQGVVLKDTMKFKGI